MKADARQFDLFAPAPAQLDLLSSSTIARGPKAANEDRGPYRHTAEELAAIEAARIAREPFIVGRPSNFTPNCPFDQRHDVQTRAATHGGKITLCRYDDPLPIEITVRGIRMVVSFGASYSIHAVDAPGSRFPSETGFRSMSGFVGSKVRRDYSPESLIADIEAYIDAPAKDGNGCGGKLPKWWPSYIRRWQQDVAFGLEYDKCRDEIWNQWGPEKHAEHWANHDQRIADALAQMRAEGINPDDVGPPHYFKGKWPIFAAVLL